MKITSRKNPAVTAFRELNRDRKKRGEERLFNIEGVRLCLEAVRSGIKIVNAFVSESAAEKYPDAYKELCEKTEPVMIDDDISSYISDTKTPQGMFITAEMLDSRSKMSKIEKGRFLLLDGLQDTGNIGTVIRTCDALGMSGLILSPECADIYSPKVVRGAMGSLFRLPFIVAPLTGIIGDMRADGYDIYAAVPDKNAESIDSVQFGEKCAFIIGNEGNGISEPVIQAAGKSIYIPIENAESLNAAVAAAIFCNEIRRQLAQTHKI